MIVPITTDEVQVSVPGELLGESDLVLPGAPRFIHHRRIGYGAVEVTVGRSLGLVAIGYVLPCESLSEPLAVD